MLLFINSYGFNIYSKTNNRYLKPIIMPGGRGNFRGGRRGGNRGSNQRGNYAKDVDKEAEKNNPFYSQFKR